MTLVRIIELGRTECDGVACFTDNLARNYIAAKLSVMAPDFYVHRIERISISQSLTDGRVDRASDNSATSHVRAIRYDVGINRSALKMNFSNCFRSLSAIGLLIALTAAPAHAQTRVGEAAVVKNEVLRVAGPSTVQINVGDGLLRDETVRTGVESATRLVMADKDNQVVTDTDPAGTTLGAHLLDLMHDAAFGALVGSFLNVCIYRLPLDKSVVWPASACPHCGRLLSWYENIPVLSWMVLRAR